MLTDLFKRIFRRSSKINCLINKKIANALDNASRSELLDKGQQIILTASLEAVELYLSEKAQKTINIPAEDKEKIVQGIIEGQNKLERRLAGKLRG